MTDLILPPDDDANRDNSGKNAEGQKDNDSINPIQSALGVGRFFIDLAGNVTDQTLEGVRKVLSGSLTWTGERLEEISGALPFVPPDSKLPKNLAESGQTLQKVGDQASDNFLQAISSTREAFRAALESIDVADDVLHKTLFENIPVSSVVGDSFAGVVKTSNIKTSFRLNGADVSVREVAADFRGSGLRKIILGVPGLFCDESLWSACGTPLPVTDLVRELGFYPLMMRFNPGDHISSNSRDLLMLMKEFTSLEEIDETPINVIAYSLGGLILRGALYQDNLAEKTQSILKGRIAKTILVSSPDGGSYLEKIGFWVGLGLEKLPLPVVNWIGYVGNQRSDAINDLSHGIIREEDWKEGGQLKRYVGRLYFGELDDVDAYQVYSQVSVADDPWVSWFGDGIVEEASLSSLSDQVYRKKPDPDNRVHVIRGKSHFQVMHSSELNKILRNILGS